MPPPKRIAALISAALLAGCAAPGTGPASGLQASVAPSASSRPATPAACPLDGFSLTTGETDGALGLRGMPVKLKNCSDSSILLDGYPGIRLADQDGRSIKFALKQGVRAVAMIDQWDKPPGRVTVRAGQSAIALLVWRNTTGYAPEGPQTATALLVSAKPGAPYRPVPVDPIDLGTTGKLAVSPWVLLEQPAQKTATAEPPTTVPPTAVPPTAVPPTAVPPTVEPSTDPPPLP